MFRVVAFDADADGDTDLFDVKATTRSDAQNRLLLNDGRGRFVDATRTHVPAAAFNSVGAGVADFDRDGDLDVVVANGRVLYAGDPLQQEDRLLVNDGQGRFSYRPITGVRKELTNGVRVGDLDGDGDVDVFTTVGAWSLPRAPTVYVNDGRGGLSVKAGACPVPTAGIAQAHLVDLDGDGDLDVVAAAVWSPAGFHVYVNRGDATFGYLGTARHPAGMASLGWVPGDFDGDGDLDAVSSDGTDRSIKLFVGATRQVFRDSRAPVRIGTVATVLLYADPGRFMMPLLGTAQKAQALPPLGILWLDPAAMVVVPPVRIPPGRVWPLYMPIPNHLPLVGQTMSVQGLDVDPTARGAHRLTGFFADPIQR